MMFGNEKSRGGAEIIAAIASIAAAKAGSKGASAERLEAMALVVAATCAGGDSVKSIEMDWKVVKVGGTDELVPIMKMEMKDHSMKTIEQVET